MKTLRRRAKLVSGAVLVWSWALPYSVCVNLWRGGWKFGWRDLKEDVTNAYRYTKQWLKDEW